MLYVGVTCRQFVSIISSLEHNCWFTRFSAAHVRLVSWTFHVVDKLTLALTSAACAFIALSILVECQKWQLALKITSLVISKDILENGRCSSRVCVCVMYEWRYHCTNNWWHVRKKDCMSNRKITRGFIVYVMAMMMMIMIITRGHSNLTKSASRGPIPRLGVTPGGRKLYHWIPGVGFPISVP